MLSEAQIPGTDDWMLVELANELGKNFPRLKELESYDDGTFVVPIEADPATREAYAKYAKRARLTFGATIIDQKVGRMNLRGFRTGAEDDINGDREASRVMRLNHFQVQFRELQRKKYLHGESYFVVGQDEFGEPFITVRDQWTVAVRMNELRPWVVDAALIISRDEVNQLDVLTLLRPEYLRVAVKEAPQSTIPTDGTEWSPGLDWDWAGQAPHGFTERVPIVPFPNKNRLGEFEPHIDSLDRITEDILERLTITAMQAFRQRAIQPADGKALPQYYPEDHPERPGEPIDYDEIYKAGPAALWMLPPGAKIWESQPINATDLTVAEKKDLEHLAGISGTPLFAFSPDVNGSAEGAKLQRETIRTRILDSRQRDAEALSAAMSLLFEAYGDQARADPTEIYTMWGQIEYVSKADVAEAARAAYQAGKSQRFIDEHIFELTPEEMELEAQNLRDEQFQASLMGVNTDGLDGGNGRPARAAETVDSGTAPAAPAGPVDELQPVVGP